MTDSLAFERFASGSSPPRGAIPKTASHSGIASASSPQPRWLTAAEAAAYLRVAPRTLVRWARRGLVPAHRLSGARRSTWRFRRDELDDMLASSSVAPAKEVGAL